MKQKHQDPQKVTINSVTRTGKKEEKTGAPWKEVSMVITSQDPPVELVAHTTELVKDGDQTTVQFYKGGGHKITFELADGTGRNDQKAPEPERQASPKSTFEGDLPPLDENQMGDIYTVFTPSQIEIMRRTNIIPVGAPQSIVVMFLDYCRLFGANPIMKEIHLQEFKSKRGEATYTIIVSYDFMRKKAGATGQYAGQSQTLFDGLTQSQWIAKNGPVNEKNYPQSAEARVFRRYPGQTARDEFFGEADWVSFYPGDYKGKTWRKYPFRMLGKAARAYALKEAFMDAIGTNVYTEEEVASMTGIAMPSPEWSGLETEPVLLAIEAANTTDELSQIRQKHEEEFKVPVVSQAWNERYEAIPPTEGIAETEIVQ